MLPQKIKLVKCQDVADLIKTLIKIVYRALLTIIKIHYRLIALLVQYYKIAKVVLIQMIVDCVMLDIYYKMVIVINVLIY